MSDYRHDFPLLRQYPKLTYLDSAATSQKPEKVIHAVQHYLTYTNSNIHRGQYKLAEQSEDLYRASKESFAQLIGASSPREVIYHHNATACMNLLVQSLIKSEIIAPGDNIVLPITEHHSNIVPRQIAGIHIRWIPITDDYALDLNKLP
jgi:cysteine desulfurase/selenocysteine lyase